MNVTKSKLLSFLGDAVISIFIVIALYAGFIFWIKYTAKPTEKFCEIIAVGAAYDDVHALVEKMGFDIKESTYSSGDEKIFFVSIQPKGVSSCILNVKDKKIVKKQFVLHLP